VPAQEEHARNAHAGDDVLLLRPRLRLLRAEILDDRKDPLVFTQTEAGSGEPTYSAIPLRAVRRQLLQSLLTACLAPRGRTHPVVCLGLEQGELSAYFAARAQR
jgi:hypothetical protein